MADGVGGAGRFVRVVNWLVRRNLTAMAVGVGMFLLAVVFESLPPHSAFLAVVFVLASSVALGAAVFGRSRVKWLPLIVLAMGLWGGILTSVWVGQAVVQLAGHDESCRYVDSADHQSQDTNGITSTSTRWVVACPDGQHTFSTAQNAEIANDDGSITIRTAGPAFTVMPLGQADDDTMWFMTLPSLAVLFGALLIALLTPRRVPLTTLTRPRPGDDDRAAVE